MNHNKQIVEIQLGRKLRSSVNVVTKCHFNLPVVIKVPPNLDDGTPFPTTYWLSCPMYTKKVGSLESTGLIKELDDQIQKDKNLYEQWSNSINVLWQSGSIQSIDTSRITNWNEINDLSKTGRLTPDAKILPR